MIPQTVLLDEHRFKMRTNQKTKTGEPESDRKHRVLVLLGLTGGCVAKILGPFDAGGGATGRTGSSYSLNRAAYTRVLN